MLNSDMSVTLRKSITSRVLALAFEALKGKSWIEVVSKDLSVVFQFVLTKKGNQNHSN